MRRRDEESWKGGLRGEGWGRGLGRKNELAGRRGREKGWGEGMENVDVDKQEANPNVIRYHGAYIDGGETSAAAEAAKAQLWIVMEWAGCGSLCDVAKHVQFSEQQLLLGIVLVAHLWQVQIERVACMLRWIHAYTRAHTSISHGFLLRISRYHASLSTII